MNMARCACRCHVGGIVVHHIPPDVRDPIEAAVACKRCINYHTPALLDGPRIVAPQADGWIDTYDDRGEGAE